MENTFMILGSSKYDKKEVKKDIPLEVNSDDVLPEPPAVEFRPSEHISEPRSLAPTAVIGPKIRFKGELIGEEDLLIEGNVEGSIDLKGNSLIVGKQGIVKANVVANSVTIHGTVEGDIYGEERISIKDSSKMTGNLIAERVTLDDGAKFKGSIDMDMDAHKDKFRNSDRSALRSVDNTELDKTSGK